jgi:hypothetical protein
VTELTAVSSKAQKNYTMYQIGEKLLSSVK